MNMLTVTDQQDKKFSLEPKDFSEASKYAEMIANSDFVPKDYKQKPGNVLIAIQMGHEIGLKPMQAIQNIAVINGRPCVWGDAILALIKPHPDFEWMKESYDENLEGGTAFCIIKKRGEPEVIGKFSVEDAKVAGLYGKVGPWQQYRKRMQQMRARGFACRDSFPHVLKGISIAEEAMDMPPEKNMGYAEVVTEEQPVNQIEAIKSKLIKKEQPAASEQPKTPASTPEAKETKKESVTQGEITADIIREKLMAAKTMPALVDAVNLSNQLASPEAKKELRDVFRTRKAELETSAS